MQRKMKVVLGATLGKKLHVAGILGVLALANACGPNESAPSVDSTSSTIVGGVRVQSGDNIASSAVLVLAWDSRGVPARCTGTLIAPDLVVTAAHCVVDEERPDRPIRASDIELLFGNVQVDFSTSPPRVQKNYGAFASQVVAHESYLKTRGSFDAIDLALIQFKAELPTGLRPAMLLPPQDISAVLQRGHRVTAAGFGFTSRQDDGRGARLRKAELQVYDSSRAKKVRLVPPGPDLQSICLGDSGGPAFATVGNAQYLWGVNVGVSRGCRYYSFTVSLPSYYDWLVAQAEAFGSAIPGLDPDFIQSQSARNACMDYLAPQQSWQVQESERFCQTSPVLIERQALRRFEHCLRTVNIDSWIFWEYKMDAAKICAEQDYIQRDIFTNSNFKTCWSSLDTLLPFDKVEALKTCADRAMRVPQNVWDDFPVCWRSQPTLHRDQKKHAISVCLKAE